jgi:hypothetical protein
MDAQGAAPPHAIPLGHCAITPCTGAILGGHGEVGRWVGFFRNKLVLVNSFGSFQGDLCDENFSVERNLIPVYGAAFLWIAFCTCC